jgi:hypothetical protein
MDLESAGAVGAASGPVERLPTPSALTRLGFLGADIERQSQHRDHRRRKRRETPLNVHAKRLAHAFRRLHLTEAGGRDRQLSLLKPYPITECRHPRPRQSAMLRNLSVLGIRSPVIVIIESHDLDRRPRYERCLAQ